MLTGCSRCGHDVGLWAHRGAVTHHRWTDTDEGTCGCHPTPICALCDHGLLKEHGLVLVDNDAPMTEGVLLN